MQQGSPDNKGDCAVKVMVTLSREKLANLADHFSDFS